MIKATELTLESCNIEISADMRGSIRSRDGVIDVIMASSRPATRCRSKLSFRSRSSKMAGLYCQLEAFVKHRLDLQYRDYVRERCDRVNVGKFNQ